jgi:hypothetical protein
VEGEEALVEEPAHDGQLVRVVQGALGVPHRRAAGAASPCSSLRQLVMLLPPEVGLGVANAQRDGGGRGSWRVRGQGGARLEVGIGAPSYARLGK